MIPMLRCLFCKRKRRLFKIYKIYGRTERPITSYIISFFGDVEEYLRDDHGICRACVFLLNKLIYIKNYMLKTIVDGTGDDESSYAPFSAAYKLFLHDLDKLNFDDSEHLEDENVSDLLKPTHSIPCDSYSDTDYDYSSDRNTPYVDQEVEKVFRKARRKRRRKSEIDDDNDTSTPLLRYDKYGRLLNKRTRSVSRILNAMQEELDSEHKDEFCNCTDCQKKQEDSNFGRENVSHHELLAKYWCCECRSGRFTSLDDFVHDKASEEMTTFYRISYDGEPQNPPNHVSQNTTGDFNVKVLVQVGKLAESPNLQFHESPVTSCEGTDIERVSANSTETRSATSERYSEGATASGCQTCTTASGCQTCATASGCQTCNTTSRSPTPSSVPSLRSTIEEFLKEAGSTGDDIYECESIGRQSTDERDSFIDRESITARETFADRELIVERDLLVDGESVAERESIAERESLAEREWYTDGGLPVEGESIADNGSVVERESIGERESSGETQSIAERESPEDGSGSIERQESIEERESLDGRESLDRRESDERGAIEERKLNETREPTENKNLFENEGEKRQLSDRTELNDDDHNSTNYFRAENYDHPRKELQVVLERLVINPDQSNLLIQHGDFPKSSTVKYMTRQRETRSRSSSSAGASETGIAEHNLFLTKQGPKSIGPSKQSGKSNPVGVQHSVRSTRNRKLGAQTYSVRTSTKTDTNDTEC